MENEKEYTPHPNLSDDINNNIKKSEEDGGLFLKNVKDGQSFTIQTKNTLYTIKKINENECEISGHIEYCPTPTKGHLNGSTWGGSMLKIGFVGIGMHLEFVLNYDANVRPMVLTTTPIKEIKLID